MWGRRKVSIAVPASLVSDTPHLREKTFRIGLVGRAAAIFRIDEIIVFPDMPMVSQAEDAQLIKTVLSYMETPQYLRKRLFKIEPKLRYVGILPPLRTPHHPLRNKISDLKIGEFREGVVVSVSKKGSFVDVGVERPMFVPKTRLQLNKRVTLKIVKFETGQHPEAVLAGREQIKDYWGYCVTVSKVPFGKLLKERKFDLAVATSRHGVPLTCIKQDLMEHWKKSNRILVAFGAPTKGLYEIVAQEGVKLEEIVDFAVNTIPCQGTKTVRTEEAVYASLAILNLLMEERKH